MRRRSKVMTSKCHFEVFKKTEKSSAFPPDFESGVRTPANFSDFQRGFSCCRGGIAQLQRPPRTCFTLSSYDTHDTHDTLVQRTQTVAHASTDNTNRAPAGPRWATLTRTAATSGRRPRPPGRGPRRARRRRAAGAGPAAARHPAAAGRRDRAPARRPASRAGAGASASTDSASATSAAPILDINNFQP